MTLLDDVQVHTRQVPGLPGDSADTVRMGQIESDLATALARPAITTLDTLTDVDMTGVADGQVPIYAGTANGGAGGYVAGDPSGAISEVRSEDLTTQVPDVSTMEFGAGLSVEDQGGGAAVAFVSFAGSGSSVAVPRLDHSHSPTILTAPQTFAATGALSSGTRTLMTYNAGPLLSGVVYDCRARVFVTVRNDINAGVVLLGLNVNSAGKTTHEVRSVGGVDVQHEWMFALQLTGAGTTVAVVADIVYSSGDPTNVRHGWVEFEAHPQR